MANIKRIIASYKTSASLDVTIIDDITGQILDDTDGIFRAEDLAADKRIALAEHLVANGFDSDIKGLFELSESRSAWPDGNKTLLFRVVGSDNVLASPQMRTVGDLEVSITALESTLATGVTVNPVQISTGVIQKKVTVVTGETIQVTRGDYLEAGDIAFNFGSDWDCTGKEVWFCVKKTATGAKLIDVECTVTDNANAVGQNPDIDIEAAALAAGEYLYEYERVLPDGTRPRTPKRGKFVVDQDIRN